MQVSYLELASIALGEKMFSMAQFYLKKYAVSSNDCSQSLWLSYQLNRKLKNDKAASKNLTKLLRDFPYSKQSMIYRESVNHVQ